MLIAGDVQGFQLTTTTDVENWPADVQGVQGPELMERFQRGLETLKRTDPQALDDVPLREALTRLERIAVGGR